MKLCYEVEIRVKRMNTPDTSGKGPFERADDIEAGMKVLIYPEIWSNPSAKETVLRQLEEAIKAFYNKADGIDPLAEERELLKELELIGEGERGNVS